MKVRLVIQKGGEVIGFADELPLEGERKRVSHVYPQNPLLRILFKFLRKVFGDEGKVADWTRRWPCTWEVRLPDGRVLKGFKNRQEAIKREKEEVFRLLLTNSNL